MVEAKSAHSVRKTRTKLSAWKHSSSQPPPVSDTSAPPFLKCRSQPPSRTAVYTCALLIPPSAARSGRPRDDLEAQQGRLKHLAACITITRFARDAAPFPLGRATRQPSVGTAETTAFLCVHFASMPPEILEPL